MSITKQPPGYLEQLRHSCSHLLAAAVLNLWPATQPTIGPATENGFYYDFDFGDIKVSEDNLPRIEKKMREIVKDWKNFERIEVSAEEASEQFKDNPYKLELIDDLEKHGTTDATEIKNLKSNQLQVTDYPPAAPSRSFGGRGKLRITLYKSGEFTDLCRGGHVENPSQELKHFKLLSVAGAYWRGDEKNKMLTRIYGTAFASKEELEQHLHNLEEAKKRDHRKLGRELGLFMFADEVGPGLPLYTEKGATIRRELERFTIDEEIKRGYKHVYTPDLARVKLYEISGHYPYYKDTMYPVMQIDEDRLVLRPMTCPHHFMLYKECPRSYRELPLRLAEVAKLYRYEKSGELTGLLRVRSFCLADAHIICRKRQAKEEIKAVIDLIDYMGSKLGLTKGKNYWFRLSLGDRSNKVKYFDDPFNWELGETILKEVLEEIKAPYYEAKDEAAFYGPKIDVQMKNVNSKEDTAFTIQYDFCMPAKFNLEFINERGEKEQPIVIHRSSIGSLERTMAFLIEHFAGAFPLWLSPVQVAFLPVSETHVEFAKKLKEEFLQVTNYGLRITIDDSNETVGSKIRQAAQQKIPYILVIGDKEINSKQFQIRVRGREELLELDKTDFIARVRQTISDKSLEL